LDIYRKKRQGGGYLFDISVIVSDFKSAVAVDLGDGPTKVFSLARIASLHLWPTAKRVAGVSGAAEGAAFGADTAFAPSDDGFAAAGAKGASMRSRRTAWK
jgi:hypothetical protein